jgi:hypothetical protein
MIKYPVVFVLVMLSFPVFSQHKMKLIDKRATKETKNLYKNLSKLSKEHIHFNHHHATESVLRIMQYCRSYTVL